MADGVGKTETKDNEGAMLQLITKSNTISKKKNPPDSSRHVQCHATREVYHTSSHAFLSSPAVNTHLTNSAKEGNPQSSH